MNNNLLSKASRQKAACLSQNNNDQKINLWIHYRILMRINLLVILLTIACVQVFADAYGQGITLKEQNISFTKLLRHIEQQSGYMFFYNKKDIEAMRPVSISITDGHLVETLDKIFANQPCGYEIRDKVIVVSPINAVSEAAVVRLPNAQLIVTGKVTDAEGNPLPGASVAVKGAEQSGVTNEQGHYSLQTTQGSVLVFSYIGYVTKEVTVGDTHEINVVLQVDLSDLEEVVVIGYGQQRKKDLTGAVASVSSAQIKDFPVASIDQKLIGQMPGVHITSPTGTPGGGTNIKVRGSGSIGAGDNPLFVIDGFAISNTTGQLYNPLNMISPDDIESVSVLKDASSRAIYGSRGANGVIVITTKKGKSGPPEVNLNTYIGTQVVPQRGRPQVLNGTEYAQFRRDIIVDRIRAEGGEATDADIPAEFRNPAQYGAGTDWYDAVLREALQNNIDLSLRGGSQSTKYAVSLGRLEQQGVLRYTDYQRYSFRANVESDLTSKLKVGLTMAPTAGVQNRLNFDSGVRDIVTRALWLSPIVPITDASGERTRFITSPGAIGAGNPLNTLEFASTEHKFFRGLATMFAEYEIIDGLRAKYSYNVDYSNNSAFTFNPSFVIGETGNQNPNPSIPGSSTSNSNALNWLSELVLTYDKQFNENHRMDVLLGYTAQKERADGYSFNATNYPDNLIETINASTLLTSPGASVEKWALLSYLARVNYSFMNRYLLTASIRTDGSSRFGANARYGTFPSAAFAWRISEEKFMQAQTVVNDLKLRVSYGLTGNYNIGNYSYASNISGANYAFGGQVANGRVSSSISNRDLTWENSKEFDAGIDLAVLNNRLNITADFYNRITTDMLYNVEIPFASGFGNATVNLGKIRNRGVEVNLVSNNLTGEFSWNTNFNITFNRNKVLALNDDNAPIYAGRSGEGNFTHKTEIGKPIGQFFGYVHTGLYADETDLNNSPRHPTSVVGSVKYKDVNEDGQILPFSDFTVIGNPHPDFIYGLTNTFGYKGFDLNVVLVGSQGGQIMKTANEFLTNIDGVFNVDRKILNRWRSPENPGDGITPTTNGARVIYRDVNSTWIEDASFLRIQNVTFGYNFKRGILSRSNVFSGLRLYGSVQNLITFTSYSGANPEASTNNSSVLTPGRDFTNYPLARVMTIGLNMTF